MAHRFKAPKTVCTYIPKRAHIPHGVTRSQELDLRRMAGMIKDEAQLTAILLQTKTAMRNGCLDRIRPYLSFKLSPDFTLPLAQ